MASLQDIFNLAKADGGKFFVMDETGEPKLVIMDIDEYQRLLLGKVKREVDDVESINQEIQRALQQEGIQDGHVLAPRNGQLASQLQDVVSDMPKAQPISNSQLKQLNNSAAVSEAEEVIDPSFDFEGPKVELEDL